MIKDKAYEAEGSWLGMALDRIWIGFFKIHIQQICKTRENSNFLKKGKIVISVKIRNFSRFQMTKRTSPLKSSREI